jgi:copper chaperone
MSLKWGFQSLEGQEPAPVFLNFFFLTLQSLEVREPENQSTMEPIMKFSVPDMSCGHCKATIGKSIAQADGTAQVEFDMENRIVTVTSTRSADEIAGVLKEAGYSSELLQQTR